MMHSQATSLRQCAQSARPLAPRKGSSAHASYPAPRHCTIARVAEAEATKAPEVEEPVFEDSYEIETLSIEQVQSLLKVVSEETNIAEVSLKLADLEVTFRRSAGVVAPPPPPPAPVAAPAPSMPMPMALESVDDMDGSMMSIDESHVSMRSPKVGLMRLHKYMKGKKVSRDPMIKVGDTVKKGQVLAFIDQLGTHAPVEATMAGEVVEMLVKEGEPVEYDQEVITLAPFFGGHIIGDAKLQF